MPSGVGRGLEAAVAEPLRHQLVIATRRDGAGVCPPPAPGGCQARARRQDAPARLSRWPPRGACAGSAPHLCNSRRRHHMQGGAASHSHWH
eukprot:scaffold1409_cov290-Prasinococcus_capsulatus_cf.AAC.3